MKSFFKKLSLVMALAMVVSLVAPAGSAFAAEAGIALQGKTDVVAEVNVEVGADVVDFCFLGAPADWKSTFKWTSSDESVATVSNAGKVTALKDGVATITITAGADASYKHSVKVTVGTVLEAEVAQTTEIQAKIKFNEKVSYKEEDMELYRVFETVEGPVEVFWPIDYFKLADDGMSITFAPFVQFGDGDVYHVKVGKFDMTLTTVIGTIEDISYVETVYGNADDNMNGKAFVTEEDDEDDSIVYLGVKMYNGTIDLTNVFKNQLEISYEMVTGESENISFDDTDGELVFYAVEPASVRAVCVYEDDNGDDKTLNNVLPTTIVPEKRPAHEIVRVTDWAVVPKNIADWQFNWGMKDVAAGDKDYMTVVKLVDNYGNTFINHASAVQYEKNCGTKNVYTLEDSLFEDSKFSIKFNSTNTDKFLIDVDGYLTTYTKANATVYVSLFQENEDGDKVFVKNIHAFTLTIKDARKLSSIAVWENGGNWDNKLELVIDSMEEYPEFTNGSFTIAGYDQYGANWPKSFGIEIENNQEVEAGSAWDYDPTTISDGTQPAYTVTVNSTELYAEAEKTTIKFTAKVVDKNIDTTFTVSLKKPDWYDTDDDDEQEEVKAYKNNVGSTTENTDILLDLSKYQVELEASTYDVQQAFDADWQKNQTGMWKNVVVDLYKLSNGQRVGYFDENTDTDVIKKVTSAEWDEATEGIAVGDRWIAVYGPDNKLITSWNKGIDAETGKTTPELWTNAVSDDNSNTRTQIAIPVVSGEGKLTYANTGKYTVKIYTVWSVTTNDKDEITDIKYVTESATAEVRNNSKKVTLKERTGIFTEKTDIKEIVLDCFDFYLDGKNWYPASTNLIEKVNIVENEDYVIVKSIVFKVPYDYSEDLSSSEAYYLYELKNINMSVELVD